MVMRKKPPGKLLPSAHAIDREFRIISALADHTGKLDARFNLGPSHSLVTFPFAAPPPFFVCSAADFPVPTPLALCEDESVIGQAFYVMEAVEGRIFRASNLPDVRPSERRAIMEEFFSVLARLHAIDFEAIGRGCWCFLICLML